MTTYEKFSCLVSGLSAILVFIGLIYTGKQLSLVRLTNKNNNDWNRRKTSFDLINDFAYGEFSRIINSLRELTELPIDDSTSYNSVTIILDKKDKIEFDKRLHRLLNYFESMAIAIKNNIVDEEMCSDCAALTCVKYYDWSVGFIEKRRLVNNSRSVYLTMERRNRKGQRK